MVWLQALLAVLWLLLALVALWRFNFRLTAGMDKRVITALLGLKLLAGAALYLIYTQHYTYRGTSDSFRYYDDAVHLNSYFVKAPEVWWRFMLGIQLDDPELQPVHDQLRSWQSSYNYGVANDNPTIVRLNMVVGLLTANGYAGHLLWMCLIALFGHVLLARGWCAITRTPRRMTYVLLGTALFPTVVFWGSSILKEVPLIFGLGLLFCGFGALFNQRYLRALVLLPAMLLLMQVKPYVVITLAPPLVVLTLALAFRVKSWLAFAVVLPLSYALAVNASVVYPPGDLLYILSKKQTDFYNVAKEHDAGSVVEISPVDQHPLGFLADLPERLALTYVRPLPSEASGALQWLAVAENLLFVLLFAGGSIALWRARRTVTSTETYRRQVALWFMVVGFIVVFGSIAGATVPVLGAIVRYKLPVLLLVGALFGGVVSILPVGSSKKSG